MHNYELILLLALGFALAMVLGYITQRLKLSPIVGYLIAGIIAGPYVPGIIIDAHLAMQLAELGIILLMFGVGLHFHLKDLLAVKWIAIPGAIGQSVVATILGTFVAHFMGLSIGAGLILGFSVAVASTVVLIRVLTDNGILDKPQGHIAIGWLIVEDIFTVLVLVLLPALGGVLSDTQSSAQTAGALDIFLQLAFALGKIGVLGVLVLVLGGKFIPYLLTLIARTRSRELFTLAVLSFALLIAVGSAEIFGASMALGAFLAGMVVGQSNVSEQAAADALPMKDAFAVIFFVSVGMLFNPFDLWENMGLFLLLMAIVLLAKPIAALLIVAILGYSSTTAFTVAIGLAQIGEFSFILSGEAKKLGLLPNVGESMLIATAIFSIALNPLLFKAVPKLENGLQKFPKIWKILNHRAAKRYEKSLLLRNQKMALQPPETKETAIIVGYGPVGSTVSRLLRKSGIKPVIIDTNVDTISMLHEKNEDAIFGEASKEDILKAAGIERAKYLIVTPPDLGLRLPIISTARHLNEHIVIYSRARYISERSAMANFGVEKVCYEEMEAAAVLAGFVLRSEGFDEKQIDSEIEKIRNEL